VNVISIKTVCSLIIGNDNRIDDSDEGLCAGKDSVLVITTGGDIGTGIALGIAATPATTGAGVAVAMGPFETIGGGGTGTGMGLISSCSGLIGLPSSCEIALANRGIVIRITTKASARHTKPICIHLIE